MLVIGMLDMATAVMFSFTENCVPVIMCNLRMCVYIYRIYVVVSIVDRPTQLASSDY